MPNPTLFSFEAPVLDVLRTLPGVFVTKTASDIELSNLSTVKPTLVVTWAADKVVQSIDTHALVEREFSVFLLVAGPTTDATDEDGQTAYAVFDALHGLELPGHTSPIEYTGGDASLDEGVRQYRLDFRVKATLATSRA